MADEIRSFNLEVVGLTVGDTAGVLRGLVETLLEFTLPTAVINSVQPRLREDTIEMFLYPPGRDRSFRPTQHDKLLTAVDKELQTMTTFGTVVRAWRTESLTITAHVDAFFDPDPESPRLVNSKIKLVGEDPLVFPPELIDTILGYTTRFCEALAVRNGGSAATTPTWNFASRPLFYLTEWNFYRKETPPAVFSYGWIEVLAPELVERLGGLGAMTSDCPAHRIVPFECPTGTGAILQATPQPRDLQGETLQQWRNWLEELFPPLRPADPDRDCGPIPAWITPQDLALCPSWQPGWLPPFKRTQPHPPGDRPVSSGNEHIIVWDRTPTQLAETTNREGLASPFQGGTVFYPADEFSTPPGTIAAELSAALGTQTMWAGTFDDDILSLMVYRQGQPQGEITIPDPADYYDLDPQEIELLAELAEQAGVPNQENSTPQQFLTAAGITPDPATTELLTELDENNFALDNQRILYQALHLPEFPIGWGHGALTHNPQHYQGPPPQPINT